MANSSFERSCRVCLSGNDVTIPLSTSVDSSTLVEMINYICTSEQIKIGDKYPQSICMNCYNDLGTSYRFKTQYENTQERLFKCYDEVVSHHTSQNYSSVLHLGSKITVKNECIDGKSTIKKLKDLLRSSLNEKEVKLDQFSKVIPYLLENKQISLKKLKLIEDNFRPTIILNYHKKYLSDEFPFKNNIENIDDSTSSEAEDNCLSHFNGSEEEYSSPKRRSKHEKCEGEGFILNYDPMYIEGKLLFEKQRKTKTVVRTKRRSGRSKTLQGNKCKESLDLNVCPICGKVFRSNLTRHIEVFHKGKRSFTCDICKKTFKDKAYLKDHENQHTGDRKYLCPLCGLAFIQHSGYRQHLRTHPELSRNKCKLCNKAFTTPGILQDHMNAHNNERKYSCNICHKRFFSQSTLRGHSVSHKERKHKCQVCSKVFPGKYELNRHMLVHTGEKPYQCDVCLAKFSQKSDMKKHIMRHFKSSDGIIQTSMKQTSSTSYRLPPDVPYTWPHQ